MMCQWLRYAASFSGYLLCCQLELLLLAGEGFRLARLGPNRAPEEFLGLKEQISLGGAVVVPGVGTGVWTLRLRGERREY